mgnify:FL=1
MKALFDLFSSLGIIGSPAGYLGSDSNVELPFDKLKSNPYQVILLDKFEKCDRAVQRLFMSVFDEGILTTNVKSGARPAATAVSKFIDNKLLSYCTQRAKTYRLNQN